MKSRELGGRWSFLALVLAFLGSTFAVGTHWLSVPHRLCAVHGTIEHGPERDVAPLPEAPPAGPIVRELERGHDECTLGPCARMEAVPLPEFEGQGRFVAEERASVVVAATPLPAVRLFLQIGRAHV